MTRDEVSALLPFLANGTLEEAERAEVESAVAGDPALQAELTTLQAIRTTMQAEEDFSPGEMGLARLMRDIPKDEPQKRVNRPWIWQAAAAVLLAVIVGQAVLLDRDGPGGFELAGGEDAPITAAFAADTPEADLRALLLSAGVEIVAGPSALGLYRLSPLEGTAIADAEVVLRSSEIVESLEVMDE